MAFFPDIYYFSVSFTFACCYRVLKWMFPQQSRSGALSLTLWDWPDITTQHCAVFALYFLLCVPFLTVPHGLWLCCAYMVLLKASLYVILTPPIKVKNIIVKWMVFRDMRTEAFDSMRCPYRQDLPFMRPVITDVVPGTPLTTRAP